MPGHGAVKRKQQEHIRAAKLAKDGLTHRQIAELLNIKPELVSKRVALGKRLLSLETEA